jgi:penicillin-insensitive murein endopeptidase
MTSDGVLVSGVRLADQGEGFVRARPGEETRFGTPTMLGALTRAAASVAETYPGSAPLRVGDVAYPGGGRHPRHGSHRTGRDVDVIFYVTDATGRSVRGRGWLGFDRFGAARETTAPEGLAPSNELFFYDDARNWHFVRTLLLDDEARVQWIFCSRGIKSRLLAYAIANEPDPRAIVRASWVLHQPSRGHPHHDHFHVRVGCTPEEMAHGCWSQGPIWPWQRGEDEKPALGEPAPLDDDALVEALLGDDGEDEVASR